MQKNFKELMWASCSDFISKNRIWEVSRTGKKEQLYGGEILGTQSRHLRTLLGGWLKLTSTMTTHSDSMHP